MMVGLVEFVYRLLNPPIEEKSPRMYHFDIAYGQLIGMLLLSLICYQFTIVGEGVYIDAIRAFIRNSSLLVKWQLFSLPVDQHEIQVFFDQLGKPREFWNAGRFTWVIVKGILMAGIIVGYAMIQKRKFYVRAIATGVLHMMAFTQLVVALYTFTAGIMLILTTVPLLLQAVIGFCMIVLCVLSTGLLLQTMGRITGGACISGTTYEGLSVMLVAILVSLLCEGLYMLTR
ncbi:hypothetical protein [Veillonella rogosae]|uniref:hypothetical protein n=1 Tax=Veillonella rogosae TaxID=423477 RepID=UPI0006D26FAA|nr:hypothetical protein [Veillonella rogosae]